jgi:hypothetical protein
MKLFVIAKKENNMHRKSLSIGQGDSDERCGPWASSSYWVVTIAGDW